MTSRLTKQCRALLRGAPRQDPGLQQHLEACAFCREWLQRRDRLADLLAQPVPPPSMLRSAAMLEGIRERIIEAGESSPLGRALEAGMPVGSLPDADLRPATALDDELAARIRRVPVAAPEWSEVRESVLGGGRRRPAVRARVLAATGVAAATVLCALLLVERGRPVRPEIVFADISSLSGVDYSPMLVLRRGGER